MSFKEELIIEEEIITVEEILELSNDEVSKKMIALLRIIASDELDPLNWSEIVEPTDFKELVRVVFCYDNHNATDSLADFLRVRSGEVEGEKKKLLKGALVSLILLIVEKELGEKYPGTALKIQNILRGVS